MQVASGVAYLHANGVMHRDVKTANVLLDDSRHAKVTDFGISTRFGRVEYTAETGTYRQMAPEVILHKPYNYKCDVYSYGILLWETVHRQVPFTGFAPLQAAFAVAMEHQRPPIDLVDDLKVYQPLSTQPANCRPSTPSQPPTQSYDGRWHPSLPHMPRIYTHSNRVSHRARAFGPSPPSPCVCVCAFAPAFVLCLPVEACWDSEPNKRPDMDQVVRVTAECAAAIESGSFRSRQATEATAPANAPTASQPRGLRGLTNALAGRLAGVNLRRPSTPNAQPEAN